MKNTIKIKMRMIKGVVWGVVLLFAVPCAAQRAAVMKMSPSLKANYIRCKNACAESGNGAGGARKSVADGAEKQLFVFVKTADDASDLYEENGCGVLATFGNIQIVRIPERNLFAVARDERVLRIEAGQLEAPANDVTSEILGAVSVHEGRQLPQAYTGKGVVMGIEDIGFDLTNPNFYSQDMSEYRIKALWDMTANGGGYDANSGVSSSSNASSAASSYSFGSDMIIGKEYTDEASLKQIQHSNDAFTCFHGSHTLGTAAGSGYNSPYAGIAPESDICLVNNITTDNKEYVAEETEAEYGTALSALGFKYIFDYAESEGKPCVISFSEGSYADFTDDTLLYYEVLSRMTGAGKIIVASAGNNSQTKCYIHKPAGRERAGSFMERSGTQLYFMAQGTDDFTARITVYGSERVSFDIETPLLADKTDSIAYDTLRVDGREYALAYVVYPSSYNEENTVLECSVDGPMNIGYSGVQPVSIEFLGESADVEAYRLLGNFVDKPAYDPDLCDAETSHNVFSPASAPSVIAVGATSYVTEYVNMAGETKVYNYGEDGTRADFSSIGPALDGRIKPDIMAPGTNIVSSTNSFFFESNPESNQWDDLVGSYEYGGRTYYWKADTGTSMSSPFVGGAIALWLEAEPDLTPGDITDILARTSSRPDSSLSYPNNLYGYGQIDIYKGMLSVLGLDGVEEISSFQPENVGISVSEGGNIDVTFKEPLHKSGEIKVFSLSGQLLKTVLVPAGKSAVRVPLRNIGKGVVAVQVNGDDVSGSGSVLVRI